MSADPQADIKGLSQGPDKTYIVMVLFLIVALASLGYGAWFAIEYADDGDRNDLTRLLSSGFLFVFSGMVSIGFWLRIVLIEHHRSLVAAIQQLQRDM